LIWRKSQPPRNDDPRDADQGDLYAGSSPDRATCLPLMAMSGQVGLAERVLAGAEAVWPLAV
jgi:hypothetical protein